MRETRGRRRSQEEEEEVSRSLAGLGLLLLSSTLCQHFCSDKLLEGEEEEEEEKDVQFTEYTEKEETTERVLDSDTMHFPCLKLVLF